MPDFLEPYYGADFDLAQHKDECDVCGSKNVILTTNRVIYGRDYGDDPKIYYCKDCHAWASAKDDPDSARGKMVSRYTHRLRKLCHDRFDYIWHTGLISRKRLYKRLSAKLKVDAKYAHFGVMSDDLLEKCVLMLYPDNGERVIQEAKDRFKENT